MPDSTATAATDALTELAEVLGQIAEMDTLIRARDVGKLIGLGRTTVYQLIGSGELATVRVGPNGRTIRVVRSSLEAYVRARATGSTAGGFSPNVTRQSAEKNAPPVATPHGAPRRTARRVSR